jgi:uncharacterized membrane-anchored protein
MTEDTASTLTAASPPGTIDRQEASLPHLATLVPPVTGIAFWTTKLLTTGAGEVVSDYLGSRPYAGVLVGLAGILLTCSLVAQFRATAYDPVRYWVAALMVSVVGTSLADVVHVAFGVSYLQSTTGLLVVLLGILRTWHRREGTLSIHSITTRRRQGFYWATVMCTFALGTAVGDLFASQLHLGYLLPGLVFTALILLPLTATRLGAHRVAMFWTAYILTRPLGASLSDWAAVRRAHGGLGLGSGPVSFILLALIAAVLVTGEIRGRRDGTALTGRGPHAAVTGPAQAEDTALLVP